MEGSAKVWHQGLTEPVQNSLTDLKDAFIKRFTRDSFDLSLLKLTQQRGETTEDFLTRVHSSTASCSLPEPVIVALAVNGLTASLKQWDHIKELPPSF